MVIGFLSVDAEVVVWYITSGHGRRVMLHISHTRHMKRGRVELLALYGLATRTVMLVSPPRSYCARLLFFRILASRLHSEA